MSVSLLGSSEARSPFTRGGQEPALTDLAKAIPDKEAIGNQKAFNESDELVIVSQREMKPSIDHLTVTASADSRSLRVEAWQDSHHFSENL